MIVRGGEGGVGERDGFLDLVGLGGGGVGWVIMGKGIWGDMGWDFWN